MECSPTNILIGNGSMLRLTVPIPKGVQDFHFMQDSRVMHELQADAHAQERRLQLSPTVCSGNEHKTQLHVDRKSLIFRLTHSARIGCHITHRK